jgi:hypothetical protein
MSEALLQATRTLAGTLQTAVGAYQRLKAENAKLEQTLKTLKDRDIAYREKLVGELKRLFPGFCRYQQAIPEVRRVCTLQKDDDILRNEKIIRGLHRLLTTGLGSMYMFVKTSRLKTDILLDVTPSTIVLKGAASTTRLQARKFQGVYQETDKKDSSPGSANFEVFRESLVADLEIMQQIGGSYFMLAFGPSGTGKTTMITHILDFLLSAPAQQVDVYQLYVRDIIARSNTALVSKPPTALVSKSSKTDVIHSAQHHTLYELFRLIPPDPRSLTHIYLNEIEQIHRIGVDFYRQVADLSQALNEEFSGRVCVKTNKWVTADALVSYISFTSVDMLRQSYLNLNQLLLSPDETEIRNLQTFYEDASENWSSRKTTFATMQNNNPLSPPKKIMDFATQSMHTFQTLCLKVKTRMIEEAFFVSRPLSEQQQESNPFWVSGGFIPLVWLQYGLPSARVPSLSEIVRRVENVDHHYKGLYVEQGTGLTLFKQGIQTLLFSDFVKDGFFNREPTDLPDYVKTLAYAQIVLMGKTFLQHYEAKKTHKIADTENEPFVLANENADFPQVPVEVFKQHVHDFSFQRSTPQNMTSSRGALVYRVPLKSGVTVTLIDLPGNEDQINDCEQKPSLRCDETRGIYHLLDVVKTYLTAKKEQQREVEYKRNGTPSTVSPVLRTIFDPMLKPTAKASFMFFAANYMTSPNFVQNAENAMKYVDELQA